MNEVLLPVWIKAIWWLASWAVKLLAELGPCFNITQVRVGFLWMGRTFQRSVTAPLKSDILFALDEQRFASCDLATILTLGVSQYER